VGFKRVIAAAIALALLVAGLGVFLVINQVGTLGGERAWVNHTRLVIETAQNLFGSLQTAEDSQRGYLISHDTGYLDIYRRADAAIPGEESRLVGLVADNPAETARVRALIAAVGARRARIAQLVRLCEAGDFAGAQVLTLGSAGRTQMEDIRARSSGIVGLENDLLARRVRNALQTQDLTLTIALAVSLLALLTLTLGAILLARANRRQQLAIDEARAAESAREASNALTEAIFTNSPDYLIVFNVEGDDRFVVADINPAFEKALRISAAQVRGRAVRDLLPKAIADRLTTHYKRVLARGAPVISRDTIPQLPDGPRIWETILAPVQDGASANRLIGTVRDITDRVRGEERLREAQRMEAIGQLTGGVAHDFNNLLQVIRGNLELLQSRVEGDERAMARLKNAMFGADRAAQLTRQLLAFARRQPLAPKVVNLSRLVSDMADLLRRTLGEAIEVETVVAGGLWNTIADPAQVESALLNLALNARDAMPSGGRLTIEITNAVLDEAYARSAGVEVAPGQYVLLAVSDTGEGMSGATKARVFEPFFTTKAEGKGTGLGLSMVYGFVKQSNGHIQIYSELGLGTTVKIYLPRSRQAETAAVAEPAEDRVGPESRTILVVEDDAAVRAATVATLEELGYGALEAADAQSALDLVEGGARFDLVFSDVVMPGPLRTRDFAQRMRVLRPAAPILFTSGYTDNAIIHQGRLDEGVNLISKPYAKAELAQRLSQLLAAQPAA
jgi:PAS domain S-box-containing protein